MKANHKGAKFMFNNTEIELKSGQFVTGRKSLSNETGIEESKIQRALNVFENSKMIEQQTNSRSRLITITYWDSYQQDEQQMNSKRTADEQQMNTNKNVKNNKNDKNVKIYSSDFEHFWFEWTNKIVNPSNKKKSFDHFLKLSDFDKKELFDSINDYSSSCNDHKFLKRCETYISQRHWEQRQFFKPKQRMLGDF